MTERKRWWGAAGVVASLVLSSLLTGPVATAAPAQEGCRPTVDMTNNNRYEGYSVAPVSNPCSLPVRGIFYYVESELVPAGPYGAPPKYTGWHCGPPVTASGDASKIRKSVGYITTYAMGYQVRGTNGLWHTEGYRNLVADPQIGKGSGPWKFDQCSGNGTQGQAESWPPPFPPALALRARA